jgi:endoglucanase
MPLTQRFVALLGCVFPWLSVFAQTSPLKLAPAARFEISGESGVSVVTDADILRGHATLGRPSNASASDLTRRYFVEFPVFHFATNEVVVRFVPKGSGTVRLRLSGYRDPAPGQVLFKEEVWWHRVSVEGALIPAEVWADRALPLRTWNQDVSDLPVRVTKDTPVVLRVAAQAVRPEGWTEMKPLLSKSTRAHEAARRYARGVTLRKFLEVPLTDPQRVSISEADLSEIRSEGFDHVRLPVAWHLELQRETGSTVPKELFAQVEELISAARRCGLSVVLGFHGFNELVQNPGGGAARLFVIWEQISQRFADVSDHLAFEILDEPGSEVPTQALMSAYEEIIPMVRAHSARRTIFVAPSGAGTFSSLAKLRLPAGDDNLIVTIDCADPVLFTQQGRTSAPLKGVLFPGPPETPLASGEGATLTAEQSRWLGRYNQRSGDRNPSSPAAFRGLIALARQWSAHYGRPVYFGELGCHAQADPVSRARYYYSFRKALEEVGMGWAILGWKGDYRYWSDSDRQPEPGLREALFGTGVPAWVTDRSKLGMSVPRNLDTPASPGSEGLAPMGAVPVGMLTRVWDRPWGWIAVGGSLLALGLLIFVFRRWMRERSAGPRLSELTIGAVRSSDRMEVLPLETARDGMLRHLARVMMESAIPRLMGQKRDLMRVQERAAQDLAQLDRRLEAIQAPLQQRLSAYQRRIVELEHQLALKGLENKELIQAKIQLARERLEAARARDALLLSKHSLN